MFIKFFLALGLATALVACEDRANDAGDTDVAPAVDREMLQQVAGATTPILEVGHMAAGAPLHIVASGMKPGQTVWIFRGVSTTAPCGTSVPRFLGSCLDIGLAKRIAHGTADRNGEFVFDTVAPATLTRSSYAFQAVSPSRRSLQSNVEVVYPTQGWLDCEEDSSAAPFTVSSGAANVNVGSILCTARGGEVTANDLYADHIGDGSFYQHVSLYHGSTVVAGPEMVDQGNTLEFDNFSYVIAAGQTVRFDLVADLVASSGTVSPQMSQFVFTSVDAEDVNGDYVSWGGVLWGPEITVVESESISCGLLRGSQPSDSNVLPRTNYDIGAWRCTASNGAARMRELVVELDGQPRMYDRLDFDIGGTPVAMAVTGSMVRLANLSVDIPDGGYIDIFLSGRTAEHQGMGGDAYSGDMVTPSLTKVEAVGLASGEWIDWQGNLSGASNVMYATFPSVVLSAGTPSGAQVAGWGEVMRFGVVASAAGDLELIAVQFEFVTSDGDNSGWNTCDTDSSSGLKSSSFSLFDRSDMTIPLDADSDWSLSSGGQVCDNVSRVLDGAFVGIDPSLVSAGNTVTYSLYMDTFGASSWASDSVRVSVTDICWNDGYVDVCGNMFPGAGVIGRTVVFN